MSEEAKTYVFGNDSNSLLPALMNNNGFGGNGAWWVILLIALLGGRGFGGFGGDGGALVGQALAGSRDAIGTLASTLNSDVNSISSAISGLQAGISSVGASLGLTGLQVINAVQSGNASVTSALQTCCCENRLLTTTQGYESRIAGAENTAAIINKIAELSTMISDKFCDLEKREMTSKIEALRETNSTLRGLIDNANQTAAITSYVNSVLAPVISDVAAIKAATPSTVTVPYPQLTAVPSPCQLAAMYGYNYYPGAWA